jgi:hypothetical protein
MVKWKIDVQLQVGVGFWTLMMSLTTPLINMHVGFGKISLADVLKLSLHIRFPHAFTEFHFDFFNLPRFCSTKVSYKKLQYNAEN